MYKADRLQVAFEEERRASWMFAGVQIRGRELRFAAWDHNYVRRNDWLFSVHVPDQWQGANYIGVAPLRIPDRSIWAGLRQRSLQFRRATRPRFHGMAYAKLAIADVRGEQNKRILKEGDRIPSWLRSFSPIAKQKVAATAGNDGGHLVALTDRHDYHKMIALFIALKAWVLDDSFDPDEATRARDEMRRRRVRARARRPLAGQSVAVTGALRSIGSRETVFNWVRALGGTPRLAVSRHTDLLLVGAHYLKRDREKIREAERLGVRTMSEATCLRRFAQ